ncbi:hypothetical protein TVAG_457100 [Trichomonas vaginalis G3]|uniref:Cep192-like domain-containing protein n=1 Tax=Trichomonas vaginalis (strain ATCC PRA-98 / G3) TaxID=412133 RepID=A2DC34_TRIV3|nr:hypothetical protein TVAGG3_0263520 [Trichomonas vaginalis G3]EAY22075.1 hypothetical protein TVAG_457100 [Trichomonas vaginalis G3]KAI5525296.1 hypothetical protein TVAGG3_0263520 [Trichomonas vaginalis G3]|eukprot:XP_001583061.1 hypothetical protein [Trichomonas vaginalis G3]
MSSEGVGDSELEMSYREEESLISDDVLKSEQVEELLQGLSFRNPEDIKIDSLLQNRSYPPVVDMFPSTIKFAHTFPNVPLSQKITLSNNGRASEHFRISISGDKVFSISEREIEIPAGTTYTLFITFTPKSIELYNGSLIIEGRKSIVAPITGHCINSPFGYPPINSEVWNFPRESTQHDLRFTNDSVSLELPVKLSVNTDLFLLSAEDFIIPPKKQVMVSLHFTPHSSMLDLDPVLSITCDVTGDKVQIPLNIAPPQSKKILNFGVGIIGKPLFHEIETTSVYQIPAVPWPFAFEQDYSDETLAVISFSSPKAGTFSGTIELCGIEYQLNATAIPVPYEITIPRKFPKEPFAFKNISGSYAAFNLNPLSSNYILNINKFDLRPNQVIEINMISKTPSDEASLTIEIKCEINDKTVTDNFAIRTTGVPSFIDVSQKSKITEADEADLLASKSEILSPGRAKPVSMIKSVTGSILYEKQSQRSKLSQSSILSSSMIEESPAKTPAKLENHNESPNKNESGSLISNDKNVKTKTSLIAFPQISKETPASYQLTVSCQSEFELEAPSWIQINQDRLESGSPILMVADSLMTSALFSSVSVRPDDGSPLDIPVIAYRGKANFVYDEIAEFQGGKVTVEVRNEGTRSGFIAISQAEEPGFDLTVSPVCAVIPAGGSKKFDFFAGENAPEEFEVSAQIYTGDEILRQLRNAVKPEGFFYTLFAKTRAKDELAPFRGKIKLLRTSSLVSLFKQHLERSLLTLKRGNPLKQNYGILPSTVELNGNTSGKFAITNFTKKAVSFSALPMKAAIIVSPTSGRISAQSDATITVTMSEQGQGDIDVTVGEEKFTVQVTQKNMIYDKPPTAFTIGSKELDFGLMNQGENKQLEIPITNFTSQKIVVDVECLDGKHSEDFEFASSISIPALSESSLVVEYTARHTSLSSAFLKLSFNDTEYNVKMFGRAFVVRQTALEFPHVGVGGSKIARVKVANKTDRIVRVLCDSSAPFFFVERDFIIEPKSFVLCPVKFSPAVPGKYEGTGEIRSEAGTLTHIVFSGICYE